MPAKDFYHEHVKNALVNEGWTITHEHLKAPWLIAICRSVRLRPAGSRCARILRASYEKGGFSGQCRRSREKQERRLPAGRRRTHLQAAIRHGGVDGKALSAM